MFGPQRVSDRSLSQRSRQLGKAIASVVGVDECVLALGLILLACGFQHMPSWAAGSYLAPAAVLLWLGIPQRSSLLKREQSAAAPRRKQ